MNSTEVRDEWADRSGAYSPEYYAYHGPDERSESVRALLERFVERDAAVLELGCSSGRHLSYLYEHGFENVSGVEVNGHAFDVMADAYPALADVGTFYHDAIEDVVREFADGRFDAVYSVETLQHVHPDAAWVFDELARITDDVLVTVENEGDGSPPAADSESGDHTDSREFDGASRESDGADSQGADPAVSYVEEAVPLYHRDWNRVFTDRGLREVDAEAGSRDTIRAFRSKPAE